MRVGLQLIFGKKHCRGDNNQYFHNWPSAQVGSRLPAVKGMSYGGNYCQTHGNMIQLDILIILIIAEYHLSHVYM